MSVRDVEPAHVAPGTVAPASRGNSARHPILPRFSHPCGLLALAMACVSAIPAAGGDDSINADPAPLASHELLLDIVRTREKLVAVGDHGDVVISRDNGLHWTQSIVPTRALLTGVSFADEQHGWAVGHDGVIIATTDGGRTWTRQDKRENIQTVFLDVLFLDTHRGFAVGAYGVFVSTTDGGALWTPSRPGPGEVHYNRISAGNGGRLYLAGESGTILITGDDGASWHRSDLPYDGSLFGVLPLEGGRLIAYGLRGHILRSDDNGETWKNEANDVPVLIMGGLRMASGSVVLVGQGGNLFVSHDHGLSFTPCKPAGFSTTVADVVEAADGSLVTVGEAGAGRIALP